MTQFMPLLEETKVEMYGALRDCTKSIFSDKKIIIMMVLITVFDLESDQSVNRLNQYFLNILRTYIERHSKNGVDHDMKSIFTCISALPRLHRLLAEMFS